MADIEIKARISADTSEATKGVDKLNNSLGATKKSTSDSVGSFGKLKDTIGSISPSAEGAIGALEGVSKTMWKLVANPVGAIILAIVAALALLYKSFTNSFEGGQKMEQIFAGIKAAGQALIDNLEKIAGAIIKLMKFDFSGAISDIKGVVKEAGEAYNAMAKLTEEAQKLHQEQLANDLDQSKRAKDLAILKEKAYDESVPIAERRKLLLQLKGESEQNAKDDIDLAKRTTDNKIAQLTLQKDGAKKNQDEINKLKIEQNNVETQNANELRAISKQIRNIDKADAAEQKKIQDENNANTKKYLELKNKIINDANIAAIQDEVKVNIQKVLNSEKDKLKEIEALKTSEKNKAELIAMIKQSSLQEIAKIERDDRIKKAKAEQAEEDKALEEKKKKDADNLAKQIAANDKKAEALFKAEEERKKKAEEQKQLGIELLNPYDKEVAQLEEAYKKKLEIAKGNEALIAAVQKEYAEATTALKAKHLNDQLNETKSVGDNIASVIGQQTAVGKGIGVANALINTYQGATDALRAKSTLPSPFDVIAKVANVAAVLASGFKAVKAITSVQVPGANGGGGAVPSVPTPITPQQISTQLNSASIQGVGNAASAGAGRSFVLDSDIKDNQERQARINRAARLG
jgi:hypothetical protein